MISKPQMMPIILEKIPTFAPRWNKHREFWDGEEAGIYNDIAEFAHFIVDAYERGNTGSIGAAFAIIEDFLTNGDQEVQGAASVGFLEGVQNIASHRPFGPSVFIEWLGPKSQLAWTQIENIWRGKRSLADVVRAEIAADKNRGKKE